MKKRRAMTNEGQKALKIYLTINRISIPEFAKRVGTGKSTIYNLTSGRALPSIPLGMKIQEETGGEVPLDSWGKNIEDKDDDSAIASSTAVISYARVSGRLGRMDRGEIPDE